MRDAGKDLRVLPTLIQHLVAQDDERRKATAATGEACGSGVAFAMVVLLFPSSSSAVAISIFTVITFGKICGWLAWAVISRRRITREALVRATRFQRLCGELQWLAADRRGILDQVILADVYGVDVEKIIDSSDRVSSEPKQAMSLLRRDLYRLLHSLFSAEGLRIFVCRGPGGEELGGGLPGPLVSHDELVQAVMDELFRRGLVGPSLFDRLRTERPGRDVEITHVEGLWHEYRALVGAPSEIPDHLTSDAHLHG